jgi:hypothetical protein
MANDVQFARPHQFDSPEQFGVLKKEYEKVSNSVPRVHLV